MAMTLIPTDLRPRRRRKAVGMTSRRERPRRREDHVRRARRALPASSWRRAIADESLAAAVFRPEPGRRRVRDDPGQRSRSRRRSASGKRSGDAMSSKEALAAHRRRATARSTRSLRYCGARTCTGRGVDAALAAGRDPGALAGVPFAVKNLFDIEGVDDDRRLAHRPRPPAGRPRRDAGAPAERRGRDPGRRAQHGRVRLRLLDRKTRTTARPAIRTIPRASPAVRRAAPAAAVAAGHGSAGAGLRHQRLDPRARGALRNLRAEADLRPAEPRRQRALRREPRSSSARSPARPSDLAATYDALQGAGPGRSGCSRPGRSSRSRRRSRKASDGLRIAVAAGYFERRANPEAFAAVESVAARARRDAPSRDCRRRPLARAAAMIITAGRRRRTASRRSHTCAARLRSE